MESHIQGNNQQWRWSEIEDEIGWSIQEGAAKGQDDRWG